MKKYTIIIEETVVDDFEVEANSVSEALKKACEKYKNYEFVLEPGSLTYKQMCSSGIEPTDWEEF